MGIISETPVWEPTIYSLETTDPVEGGVGGISNRSRKELANRTLQIKEVLKQHGIFADPTEFEYAGQWVDANPTFEGSVVDGEVVYYNIGNTRYEKALADGTVKQNFVGVADVTNDKVIGGGFLENPIISGSPVQGDIIYLSDTTPGQMTTTVTPIAVGKYLFTNFIVLNAGVGGAGAGAGAYQHEQDTYRMLLEDSYFKNMTFDHFIDESLVDTTTMDYDFANNKYDFAAAEVMESINLKDPLVSLTIERVFVSVDITDSGATLIEVTADGGSNWETVENDTLHEFSNTGSDLRIRITAGGTGELRSYALLYNPDPSQQPIEQQSLIGLGDFRGFKRPVSFFHLGAGTDIQIAYGGRYFWENVANNLQLIVEFNSSITFDLGPGGSNPDSDAAGTNLIQYICIDGSQLIADPSTIVMTASKLVNLQTAPTFDPVRNGWYVGEDLCIGAFYINSSGNFKRFTHHHNVIMWTQDIRIFDSGTHGNVGTGWSTTPAFIVPTFSHAVVATFWNLASPKNAALFYRPTGSGVAGGHEVNRSWVDNSGDNQGRLYEHNTVDHVGLDFTTKTIDLRATASFYAHVEQNGYHLPSSLIS